MLQDYTLVHLNNIIIYICSDGNVVNPNCDCLRNIRPSNLLYATIIGGSVIKPLVLSPPVSGISKASK